MRLLNLRNKQCIKKFGEKLKGGYAEKIGQVSCKSNLNTKNSESGSKPFEYPIVST